MASENSGRFVSLDGWRGVSILLVLAAHLLPLGPRAWQLNLAAGMAGMALFFTLSGFLVTQLLLRQPSTTDFLLRRLFRIVPLAWAYMLLVLLANPAPLAVWLAHFLFYANVPPQPLLPDTEHLWSLCVEMQFYAGVALLYFLSKRRGLLLLPLLCVGITLLRVFHGVPYSSVTWYRIDEILAGSALAQINALPACARLRAALQPIHTLWILPLLLLSCHPAGGYIDYLRPYAATLLVGSTLLNPQSRLTSALNNRALVYIASISYALYVLHPALAHSWFGNGDEIEKYAKRPLLFVLLFLLAHVSTRCFEQPGINFGKRLAQRWQSHFVATQTVFGK